VNDNVLPRWQAVTVGACTDGDGLYGSLAMDAKGNPYDTISLGGTNTDMPSETVFKLTP